MTDPNSDVLYAALEREFGGPIHGWPLPDGSVMSRIRINPALAAVGLPAADDEFAGRFMDELQHGQIDEDFGDFLWRCWCRAMQVPNEFLDRYGRGHAPQAPTSAPAATFDFAGMIESLEDIIENDDVEYAGELADAEATGERPDLDDREVSVPVEWLRQIVAHLQAQPDDFRRRTTTVF